jgi:hypothetical protein
MPITISGRIVDRQTETGVPGLRVEVWSVNAALEEPLIEFKTVKNGVFKFDVDAENLERMRRYEQSELTVQIYRGNEHIPTTKYPLTFKLEELSSELIIQVDLPLAEEQVRRVAGQVCTPDGIPLPEVIVIAFDTDLDDSLGEAKTDENGIYRIDYPTEPLRQARKQSADLMLRVGTPEGKTLGRSEILADAPPDARLDVVIQQASSPEPSEYEQYRNRLVVELPYQELRRLDEKAISALARRTGINRTHLNHIAQSIRLGDSSGLPDDILYGLLRQDLPSEADALFVQPLERVREALEAAINQNIITTAHLASLEELVQRFEKQHELYLPLTQVAPTIGLEEDLLLFEHLARHGIQTLADIRSAGGIAHLPELPLEPEDPAVLTLEAHARLSLLPTALAVNTQLIESGFTSLDEIAEMPRNTFIATLQDKLPEEVATKTYNTATVQAKYLTDVLANHQINVANGDKQAISQFLSAALPSVCGCKNCENATSPMAYLFDLLDYAVRHLKYQNNPVTLTFLQNYFHQPFRDLPLTCEQMDLQVRQVRICIEVLRKHVNAQYAGYTPKWYLEAAYEMLLEQLGINYDDLRRARTLVYRLRVELARRLALFVHPFQYQPPDVLDSLLIDPDDPASLTEAQLEAFFGLRMTTRDPLDPDVVQNSLYLGARIRYLRRVLWYEADWPANPPVAAAPLIDPDIVSPLDMVFAVPTPPGVVRVPTQPIHFWEDREKQLSQWRITIQDIREHPNGGYEALITDESIVNGRLIK